MIFGLCGSLRADSSNGRLLAMVAGLVPGGTFDHFESLASLPAFDPALDYTPPAVVADLRARVKAADAILIASPEYAHGIPGSLKNALDWMVGSGELIDKPVGIIVASSTDGAFARENLAEVLRTMSAKVPDERVLGIAQIKVKLPLGGPPDPAMIEQIKGLLTAFGSI